MRSERSLVLKERAEVVLADEVLAARGPSLEETRRELHSSARRRFGGVPAELIVDHVLAMTEDADFPVRQAALDALVRRMTFAVRDGLVILARPPRGTTLGPYTTARAPARGRTRGDARSVQRPYVTLLESIRPLTGSCDCPDFVRSSLGLCKHLLVVLDAVHRAGRETAGVSPRGPRSTRAPGARLIWSPSLPLLGPLDRAAGLRLEVAPGSRSDVSLAIRRCFSHPPKASAMSGAALRPDVLDDLRARAALLERLLATIAERGSRLEAMPAARRVVDEERERASRRARCAAHAPARAWPSSPGR